MRTVDFHTGMQQTIIQIWIGGEDAYEVMASIAAEDGVSDAEQQKMSLESGNP